MSYAKANTALDELPGGRRGRSARKSMGLAKILGGIGMGLSTVALLVGVTWTIVDSLREKKPPAVAQGPPQGNEILPPQEKEKPPPGIDIPVKKPLVPPLKYHLKIYRVTGNPTPAQQADRVKKTLDATAGVLPGSVEVSETEIRVHTAPGANVIPVYDAVTKLGYKVIQSSSSPVR